MSSKDQLIIKDDFTAQVRRWVLLDSQLKMINEVVNPLFEMNVVNKFKTREKN